MGQTRETILDEIRRTAAANEGTALGKQRFLAETGIKESDWAGKYWARWSDAVRDAGVSINRMNPSLSDDVVLLKLADFIASIGHFPVREELKLRATTDAHFPAATTFTRKYGPKSALASRLRDFCLTRPGYEAVVSICAPIAEQTNSELSVKPADEIGYVYLIKSGRYYKLGRTNSVGRRQYELSIQLPEKVVLVHSITTDDPAGIEAYWHRRFDAFRKNGEWFQLSVPEVNAFKRRKFM